MGDEGEVASPAELPDFLQKAETIFSLVAELDTEDRRLSREELISAHAEGMALFDTLDSDQTGYVSTQVLTHSVPFHRLLVHVASSSLSLSLLPLSLLPLPLFDPFIVL